LPTLVRTNQHGKDIRKVLEWLTNRDVADFQMAAALGEPAATYSRRKREDNFPTFEQLSARGAHFGCGARVLQIAFGWRGDDELVLLNADEIAQYIEQGGGVSPLPVADRAGARDPSTAKKREGQRARPS
jgi:hypothetical protein